MKKAFKSGVGFLLFLASCFSAGQGFSDPGLTMQTISQGKIEGTYRDFSGEGIHFMSEANGVGGGRLIISTLQGEPIINAVKSHREGVHLMSVLDDHFLLTSDLTDRRFATEQRSTKREYVLHGTLLHAVRSAIQDRNDAHIEALLPYLDSESAPITRERALGNLLGRVEVQMMAKAAKALGEKGVSGKDNAAARMFYVYAMRLENSQRKESVRTQGKSFPLTQINNYGVTPGQYASIMQTSEGETCTREGFEECPKDKCPAGEYCRGMCGPTCTWCWSYVCGDCCYHQGCAEHDDCCGVEGYASWACLTVPWGFECDAPYQCSSFWV